MTFDRQLFARSWRAWFSMDAEPAVPAWMQWLCTLLFCITIALGFTVLGLAINAADGGQGWRRPWLWPGWFALNLVVSLCIGVLIHLLFQASAAVITPARLRRFTPRQRWAYFSAVPLTGVLLGWPFGMWLLGPEMGGWVDWGSTGRLLGSAAVSLLISFVIILIFSARMRQVEAEKRATEAQLRLLQAQMEPHFLFNTLANVLTLIDAEPARARHMLEAFTDYLRATLAQLRQSDSTLAQELALAEAYLKLLGLRMEDRLRFDLQADDEARAAAIPPLLLQPLVENAIQHGLEPKLEGGCVRVNAQVVAGKLRLTVSDDGLGLHTGTPRRKPGTGIALDNIRQRLQAQFGQAASLQLEDLSPGTRATLTLPLLTPTKTCP